MVRIVSILFSCYLTCPLDAEVVGNWFFGDAPDLTPPDPYTPHRLRGKLLLARSDEGFSLWRIQDGRVRLVVAEGDARLGQNRLEIPGPTPSHGSIFNEMLCTGETCYFTTLRTLRPPGGHAQLWQVGPDLVMKRLYQLNDTITVIVGTRTVTGTLQGFNGPFLGADGRLTAKFSVKAETSSSGVSGVFELGQSPLISLLSPTSYVESVPSKPIRLWYIMDALLGGREDLWTLRAYQEPRSTSLKPELGVLPLAHPENYAALIVPERAFDAEIVERVMRCGVYDRGKIWATYLVRVDEKLLGRLAFIDAGKSSRIVKSEVLGANSIAVVDANSERVLIAAGRELWLWSEKDRTLARLSPQPSSWALATFGGTGEIVLAVTGANGVFQRWMRAVAPVISEPAAASKSGERASVTCANCALPGGRAEIILNGQTVVPAIATTKDVIFEPPPPGEYGLQVRIVFGSNQHVISNTVKFAVASSVAVPAPTLSGAVVHGALFAPGAVVPGMFGSVFGQRLGRCGEPSRDAAYELGGLGITVCDLPARLYACIRTDATETYQVNFLVPSGIAGQAQCAIKAKIDGVDSNTLVVAVASQRLGLFQFRAGDTLLPIITNAAYQLIGPPSIANYLVGAKRGEPVILWATGGGTTDVLVRDNEQAPTAEPLARLSNVPVVSIGGQVSTVLFAGRAPGFTGLDQIVVLVPRTAQSGRSVLQMGERGYDFWVE